ncbi:MAG: GAP family protein [Mycobacteriaceae bacterium]|uniref:GAP family protein n=1 Tax=Corynebacterium sp. TaxID=1720 RepID=UPI003F996546
MDVLPDHLGYLSLLVLALVDSTSIGTLVVPVLLLVTAGAAGTTGNARRFAGRTLYYLLVIGVFYWALGLALTAGAMPLLERFQDVLTSTAAMAVYAVAGVLLLALSFWIDPKAIRKRGGDPEAGARRWLERVRRAGGSLRALTGLALVAGVVEAASMIPYIAAVGIIADSGTGMGGAALILVGYCAVMLLPGVILSLGRALAGSRVDGLLDRIRAWGIRSAADTLSWTVGIVGVIITLNTAPAVLG